MSGRYLLDTNVAIRILNEQVDLEPRQAGDAEVFLCLTVLGELFYGAANSGRPERNRRQIQGLLDACHLLPHDRETAEAYGAIKAELKKLGRPIPENDIWIAASAQRHRAVVVSADRHFHEVEGLPIEVW